MAGRGWRDPAKDRRAEVAQGVGKGWRRGARQALAGAARQRTMCPGEGWRGLDWCGGRGDTRLAAARRGVAGEARNGRPGVARHALARCGAAGVDGKARNGEAGLARTGNVGEAGPALAGLAWIGNVWRGRACLCRVRHGKVRRGGHA
jgi:hypothetical protein